MINGLQYVIRLVQDDQGIAGYIELLSVSTYLPMFRYKLTMSLLFLHCALQTACGVALGFPGSTPRIWREFFKANVTATWSRCSMLLLELHHRQRKSKSPIAVDGGASMDRVFNKPHALETSRRIPIILGIEVLEKENGGTGDQ